MADPMVPSSLLSRLRRGAGSLRRKVLVHRRGLAALFVGLAVAAGVRAVAAPPPPAETAWTAVRDLPAGHALTGQDLVATRFAAGTVPAGAVHDPGRVLGRLLVSPVRRGEPLTDARVLGRGLLGRMPGRTATPVRLADPGVLDLLRVGDAVDLVATDPQGERAPRVVSRDARVLLVPKSDELDPGTGVSGGLVVLAVASTDAVAVTSAGVADFLTVLLRR